MKKVLSIFVPIFWAGLIAGISFLEAPLKFQAPGITIPLGLGIGQLVFQALNKIEIVLGLLLIVSLFKTPLKNTAGFLLASVILLLSLESLWLLPYLDAKAKLVLAGNPRVESYHHFVYIAFDVLKFVFLVALGYLNIKKLAHEKRY
jgi:hypothetical protein